jgi:hypothetical protein
MKPPSGRWCAPHYSIIVAASSIAPARRGRAGRAATLAGSARRTTTPRSTRTTGARRGVASPPARSAACSIRTGNLRSRVRSRPFGPPRRQQRQAARRGRVHQGRERPGRLGQADLLRASLGPLIISYHEVALIRLVRPITPRNIQPLLPTTRTKVPQFRTPTLDLPHHSSEHSQRRAPTREELSAEACWELGPRTEIAR